MDALKVGRRDESVGFDLRVVGSVLLKGDNVLLRVVLPRGFDGGSVQRSLDGQETPGGLSDDAAQRRDLARVFLSDRTELGGGGLFGGHMGLGASWAYGLI